MTVVTRDLRFRDRKWKGLRLFVLDRDGWQCQIRDRGCTQVATSVDHITATVEGGSFWDPANLRAACKHCNTLRGSRLATTRAARYRTGVARYQSRF